MGFCFVFLALPVPALKEKCRKQADHEPDLNLLLCSVTFGFGGGFLSDPS